ncbi:MmcQ/YjbR family DNA-binding protein [Rhodococcoides kroppenstedtii]|uniref:MmcQ/YjbR family DNA-binding protein n=1 Tax=Rhodococcoides kroppenstedtii TaxID=293050 RepID=UPI001BDE1EAB|nr:MmcQ/YjbR family DNA-binding protein [Rhodococcus kroppenstedtii]MBT1190627.1 MmcQ/YjbR family DNA-binding protein [Rhodococcus kroppenstedtii]
MAHPVRFDDDDALLRRVRELALGFPGAAEKVSHGRPQFFTTKTFAVYGATVKGDHHSTRWSRSLQFLPDPDEHEALLGDSRFFVPAYWGPAGWLALDLTADEPDWDEVRELIDMSYRRTATRRLVAELDARS